MKKNLRILIVDDDEVIADVTSEIMDYFFPSSFISTASNPIDALDLLKRRYDIVISDLDLRNNSLTGIDVLLRAKILYSGIRTVLMSGDFENKAITSKLEVGIEEIVKMGKIDALWKKPFSPKEVGETISGWAEFSEEGE